MKVLVLGATGLIGSAVVARLAADGHEVVAAARHPPETILSSAKWRSFDFTEVNRAGHWPGILTGVDAVVNCAGILQDGPAGSTEAVHASGPAAFFEACRAQGICRVVHISAVGVDRETPHASRKQSSRATRR